MWHWGINNKADIHCRYYWIYGKDLLFSWRIYSICDCFQVRRKEKSWSLNHCTQRYTDLNWFFAYFELILPLIIFTQCGYKQWRRMSIEVWEDVRVDNTNVLLFCLSNVQWDVRYAAPHTKHGFCFPFNNSIHIHHSLH